MCSPLHSEPRSLALPPRRVARNPCSAPVRALRVYIEAFCLIRKVRTAFVGFGNRAKGGPVTKQGIYRWLVDAITLAYSPLGLQCPIGVRAHSTRVHDALPSPLTIQIKLRWALFVTYTIIQSIMRSEMCSLHLTHPSAHTWSSRQPTVQRPGSSRGLPAVAGIRTHNLGLPRVSSPTLYPLGHDFPICEVADWSSPSTFVRFYNLDVPASQARILSA